MTYHPQAQQLLDAIAESGAPPLTDMTPEEVRLAPAILMEMVGSGLAYAAALKAAGVSVTVARYDDQIHAFFVLVNLLESADRAVAEAGGAIRDALAAHVSA